MERVWTEQFAVRTYELDGSGKLAVPAVCNYLQEAAGHHAHALGVSIPQLEPQNMTWVLSRLLVRMRAWPGWDAGVAVQTWPSGVRKLFALRDFRIFCGGSAIGEATSAWLLLDTRSWRPVRVERTFAERIPIHPERAVATNLDRLPDPAGSGLEIRFQARYRDLDMNRHVNNVAYVQWALETLPPELRAERALAELEINFLAEANYGQELLARAEKAPSTPDEAAFRHGLFSGADGRELARARTTWVSRSPATDAGGRT